MRAIAGDIFAVAARLREGAAHVLWLDLEENGARIAGAVCAAARACAVVHLTLTCRAEDKYAVSRRAEAILAEAGLRRALTTQYPGRSGVTQMVHATGVRRDAALPHAPAPPSYAMVGSEPGHPRGEIAEPRPSAVRRLAL